MKSYGNRGSNPGRNPRKPQRDVQNAPGGYRRPYLNEDYQQEPEQPPSRGGWDNQGNYPQQNQERYAESQDEASDYAVRIEPGKRAGALLIDFVAGYLVSVVLSVPVAWLPFVSQFMPVQFLLPTFLLFRDSFFEGRGIGKNLMGLQVVDAQTGAPCTVAQSFMRNIIILAPYLVLLIIQILMSITGFVNFDVPWWSSVNTILHEVLGGLVNIVGMIYVAIVLPMECYRAWRREDSLRKGDELAGTMVVDAPMDFSNPLPRSFS